MSIRVFNLGPGVVIIIMIWVVLYLLSRATNRAKGIELGIAPIILGIFLTTCLVLWPLEAETHGEIQAAEGKKVPIDYIFIMRLTLLVFLTVFTLALFYYLVKYVFMFWHRIPNYRIRSEAILERFH